MAAVTELEAGGVKVPAVVGGQGRPLLFLHDFEGLRVGAPIYDLLAERFRVVAPWLPGFGPVTLPKGWRSVHDLAYFALDVADSLDLQDAVLVGASFGGWVAVEAAVRNSGRFGALVLVDALGLKHGDRLTRDIADIHSMPEAEAKPLLWRDPPAVPDYAAMAESAVAELVRSRETFAYMGWKPYMHDPDLKRWLHRIGRPSLLLWGEDDRFVTPDYGRKYAEAIPGARFETIPRAAHFPHVEAAEATARQIAAFAGG